jgi:hypothetical protein
MTRAHLEQLAELKDSDYHQRLLAQREEVVALWTASDDDSRDKLLKGEKRVLDRLIEEIETAQEILRRSRRSAERSSMSHSF